MNFPGYLPKLNCTTLMVFLLAAAAFPDDCRAQVDIDDMGSLGYEATDLGAVEMNGELCRKIRLDNVPGVEMPFPKMIMVVRQADNYPLQVDYYDEQGRKIKTLQTQSIERINGMPASMKMTMKNHLDSTETNFDLTINYEE
jgi:hypothetical protein